MKKIFLVIVWCMSILIAEAQSKNKKSKKNPTNIESTGNAGLEKMQLERQQLAAIQQAERIRYDSTRVENERLTNEQFENERSAWKENRIREMDSFYMEKWKAQSTEKEQWLKIQRQRDEVNSNAKLDSYKSRQVNFINQTYHDRARSVSEDSVMTDDQKREQYQILNTERRARIKAVVGKSKERKLEKSRKTFSQKNSEDVEANWINEADAFRQ